MAGHEGSFEVNGDEYNYKMIEWKEELGQYKTDIDDDDLLRVDDMRIEIENPETGETQYQTVNGPMDDWDFVEDLLSYDWGGEGSRSFR